MIPARRRAAGRYPLILRLCDGIAPACRGMLGMLLVWWAATGPAAACDLCRQLAGDGSGQLAPAFGTPRPGWPQAGPGDPVHLSYSYNNLLDGGLRNTAGEPVPPAAIRTAIEEAFVVWAAVAPLHFTEVPDEGGPAYTADYPDGQFGQIRFSHRYINGPDPPVGTPRTKAIAWFPSLTTNIGADIHFDNGDPWETVGTLSQPDLLGAAIHEIGHALGLTHSSDPTANMYWIFKRHTGPGSGMLAADDIAAIQSVYGPGIGSVTPLVRAVPEPDGVTIAMLLAACGFACTKKLPTRSGG